MKKFFYATDKKLREIFTDHCALSAGQYDVISAEFIYLVSDIQEEETSLEIQKRIAKMKVIFDFLLESGDLTLREHNELGELVDDVWRRSKE